MVVLAAALLVWANWPVYASTRTSHLHLILPESWDAAAGQDGEIPIESTLIHPEAMKIGQIGRYQIILQGLPGSIAAQDMTWQLHIRSELILPGFLNQQEGMLSQAVQGGNPVRFNWNVRAGAERHSTGVLRIFVDYLSPSGETRSELLSVTEMELTSTSLVGLTTTAATSLAVAFLLLAGLTGALGTSRPRA